MGGPKMFGVDLIPRTQKLGFCGAFKGQDKVTCLKASGIKTSLYAQACERPLQQRDRSQRELNPAFSQQSVFSRTRARVPSVHTHKHAASCAGSQMDLLLAVQ